MCVYIQGVWLPEDSDTSPWIQADLGERKHILRIITHGRSDRWVKSFTVLYSDDGAEWTTVNDGNGQEIMFSTETHRAVSFSMPPGLVARYVRFMPQTWNNSVGLSWGIVGCPA